MCGGGVNGKMVSDMKNKNHFFLLIFALILIFVILNSHSQFFQTSSRKGNDFQNDFVDSKLLLEKDSTYQYDTDYFTAYLPVHWQRESAEEIETPKVYTFFSEKESLSQETGDLYPGFAQFSIEVDPTSIFPLDIYQEYYGSGSPVMVTNGKGIQWSGYDGIGGSVFSVTTIINNEEGASFKLYFYTQDQEYQDEFLNEYNTFVSSFLIK